MSQKANITPQELLQFRIDKKLSQQGLGNILGVTWQAVRMWELGERKIPTTASKAVRLFIKFPQVMREF